MVCGNEDEMLLDIEIQSRHINQIIRFKYLGFIDDDKSTEEVECEKKVINKAKILGSIRACVWLRIRIVQIDTLRALE